MSEQNEDYLGSATDLVGGLVGAPVTIGEDGTERGRVLKVESSEDGLLLVQIQLDESAIDFDHLSSGEISVGYEVTIDKASLPTESMGKPSGPIFVEEFWPRHVLRLLKSTPGRDSGVLKSLERLDRLNRAVVLATGGGFLGGFFFQVPGAFIGSALGGLFGYCRSVPHRPKPSLEYAVLRMIDERLRTIEDLANDFDLPLSAAQSLVQGLWEEGQVDKLTGNVLRYFFPYLFRGPFNIAVDAPICLTIKGYCRIHPLVTPRRSR